MPKVNLSDAQRETMKTAFANRNAGHRLRTGKTIDVYAPHHDTSDPQVDPERSRKCHGGGLYRESLIASDPTLGVAAAANIQISG